MAPAPSRAPSLADYLCVVGTAGSPDPARRALVAYAWASMARHRERRRAGTPWVVDEFFVEWTGGAPGAQALYDDFCRYAAREGRHVENWQDIATNPTNPVWADCYVEDEWPTIRGTLERVAAP